MSDSSISSDSPEFPARPRPPFNEVSVLFPLLSLYTAGYLALMLADFALRSALLLPDGMMSIYIALVGAYAADKEIRRWMGAPEPPRRGSLFVYLWLLLYLAMYIVFCFRPDFTIPGNMATVSLQVLGIFFGSKASKYVCERRDNGTDQDEGRKGIILDLLGKQGQITRKDVAEQLRVSTATAGRLLSVMEGTGAIRRAGSGKGTYYVSSTKST